MSWKKDNPGSPCCSCECPCYPLDGNGRDYHRHLDLVTSGTVAYSTVAKLGTKAAEFSGGGYLHQSQNRCYSIGNGLRMWGWFRMDGTQATSLYSQNIISLGGVVSQSSVGGPFTRTGGGGLAYRNFAGGLPVESVPPVQPYQPDPSGGGLYVYPGRIGAWPSTDGPHWSFFHFTFLSSATALHHGVETSPSLNLQTGIKHSDFGTSIQRSLLIGGAPDARHNAGSSVYGGSTTGTSAIKVDNVGFSKDISNYTAKATNLFNSGNGRVCPAST